ncbi:SLAP domain-containing protein [Metabacillus malikii]|uniref:SLAP domain-containing protein n=1 Tax=Metabacillus malikii TaxID=1504265 RepID=A0ABT9ZCD7_9BACI|nr:SLAP domain-containing protein [Metabacillus malikii]MDQ0229913.1 SLAP domain-containing protein [Metabacillus malikii]
MQQLQFEPSWNKTLAASDRQLIDKIFHETKHLNDLNIGCSIIRVATNHKLALLVTVLIHNFTGDPLSFNNNRLQYIDKEEIIADMTFTLPKLMIPPYVSMPWTFIFPLGSYTHKDSYDNGQLILCDSKAR